MLILIGKTCSGKDTILNELVKRGYKKLITYTTRPIRKGEIDGISYNFITDEEFQDKINTGYFMEYQAFQTTNGTWYYGSALIDYEKATDKTVVILTPQGYKNFLKNVFIPHNAIYIYANNNTISKRLKKRGDSREEAERRLLHDNEDFKGIENEVTRIIYNNEGSDINDVVKKIIKYSKESP